MRRLALVLPALLLPVLMLSGGDRVKRPNPIAAVVRQALPSVLHLKVLRQGNWGKKENSATAVVFDARGLAVTCQHAVADAHQVTAVLPDGGECAVAVQAEHASADLAVLQLPAGGKYRALALGRSGDLEVGEPVIAIGNPYGYHNTVATGIVSGLDRTITMPGVKGWVLNKLVQTTVGLNSGNSGGPLLNMDGELIGINVATHEGAQGISFALSIDSIRELLVAPEKLRSCPCRN